MRPAVTQVHARRSLRLQAANFLQPTAESRHAVGVCAKSAREGGRHGSVRGALWKKPHVAGFSHRRDRGMPLCIV